MNADARSPDYTAWRKSEQPRPSRDLSFGMTFPRYRIDKDAILVLEVLKKKTQQTPKATIDVCKARLKEWDRSK